jgi:hypothetical protein
MKRCLASLVLVVVLGFCGNADAKLWDRGGGLIYDDVLNITWLQDANYAQTSGYDADGRMMWDQAMDWAANLVYGGYDDWRLPTGDPIGSTEGELMQLYYELGNSLGGPLTNSSPFVNVQLSERYWTSTSYTLDSNLACDIYFNIGKQNHDNKVCWLYAWAVRDGDVATQSASVNLSLLPGTTATADDVYLDYYASYAIDGNLGGHWWSARNNGTPTNPHWLIVDLGSLCSIEKIVLITGDTEWPSEYYVAYDLYTSVDGVEWQKLGSGSLVDSPDGYWDELDAAWLTARYVKFEAVGGTHWAHLAEIEIWGRQVEDITPPQLVEFSFTPTTIDTHSGPQTVTFSMRITDDISGFDHMWLRVASPSKQQSITETVGSSNLVSGNLQDGVYSFTMNFPQFAEVGSWCVDSMYLKDRATNIVNPDLSSLPCVMIIFNQPPTANAGENMSKASDQVASTTILGMGTDQDQGDVLTYRWLEEGTTVLLDWTEVGAGDECPLDLSTLALGVGAHTLVLEVSDGKVTATDEMILTIDNSAPHAAPSGGGSYQIGSSVSLAGQVSDFDGDLLKYSWKEGADVLCSGTVQALPVGAPVNLPDDACVVSGFALGDHTIILEVSDGINDPVVSTIIVTIIDNSAPTLAPEADKMILWPPNHGMVNVTIAANAADNSGLVVLSAVVSSNEAQEGLGDGDTAPDWTEPVIDQVNGVITLQLRAERSGSGNGRTYTIMVTATDAAGNASMENVKIIVPHDKGKK